MMQDADGFKKGWRVFIEPLTMARLVLVWLTAGLILGVGPQFHTSVVQAQDGGQAQEVYRLVVDTGGLSLNKMCVGSVVSFPVSVQAVVQLPGSSDIGRLEVRQLDLDATVQNPDILSETENSARTANVTSDRPMDTAFIYTGAKVGTTSIVFRAVVQTNQGTYPMRQAVPVQVVPCAFKVNIMSVWVTTMYDASTIIIAGGYNAVLTSTTGHSFAADQSASQTLLDLDISTNRLLGCAPGHQHYRLQPYGLTGEILDDQLNITVTYPTYEDDLICDRTVVEMVRNPPDGCAVIDNKCGPLPYPYSATPETLNVSVPLDGGTVTQQHVLTDSPGGRADGRATVTVTPIEQQGR